MKTCPKPLHPIALFFPFDLKAPRSRAGQYNSEYLRAHRRRGRQAERRYSGGRASPKGVIFSASWMKAEFSVDAGSCFWLKNKKTTVFQSKYGGFMVAEEGFEPPTSGLWATFQVTLNLEVGGSFYIDVYRKNEKYCKFLRKTNFWSWLACSPTVSNVKQIKCKWRFDRIHWVGRYRCFDSNLKMECT